MTPEEVGAEGLRIGALFKLRGLNLMMQYYVVGGEYRDTHFREAVGGNEEWFGPFTDYEAAKEEWAKHAWQTVDNCTTRYRIECIDNDGPPPCTD